MLPIILLKNFTNTRKWHKFLTAENVLCVKNALHEPVSTETVENVAISSGWKYDPKEQRYSIFLPRNSWCVNWYVGTPDNARPQTSGTITNVFTNY